jgi:2-polyprenyl-3-methyl-5-hydroxy-6-metoxy-1,4-benzoquinol methylase
MVDDESHQVSEYWNQIAPDFDAIYSGKKSRSSRLLDLWLRRDMYQRFDWVMGRARNIRGASVCDVGCGSGRFVTALAKQGARVTGLDFAPRMLDLARELAESEGVAPSCRFVLSDVLDWSTNEQFDLVIAMGFWDYVADPLPRLRLIRRITSGTFLSTWPRAGTSRAAIRRLRLKLAGCPVYFWRPEQIKDYLMQAGFRANSWEVYGQLHCVDCRPVIG